MNARPEPETLAAAPMAASANRRRARLLMLLPALLLAAIGLWLWQSRSGSVSTDNAQVQQERLAISADVTGRIAEVLVTESQPVTRGQLLIRLADEPFRIALAEAEARLATARLDVAERGSAVESRSADIAARRDAVQFARAELARQQGLINQGFATRARLEAAQSALAQAEAALEAATADARAARARAGNAAPAATHPLVQAAEAARDKAAFDLSRTLIKAPASGIATQTSRVIPGQVMAVGIPTMAIMLSEGSWIEANFKETDIGRLRPGQPAEIRLDAYPDQPIPGRVSIIGAGTGATFSVLPAQNATGNWVKVIQRVPVRIAIEGKSPVPLIAGLSARVTVDTSPQR
jgi:membrane fusion protein (multidrug efflux system)